MKKYIILLFTLLISAISYSQVGINTGTPKTTLDIRGKMDGSGNPSNTDVAGIQAPRLTLEQLTNKGNSLYGADQIGAIVYITNVSGGNNTGQRVNITQAGYYYFDGKLWQGIVTETGSVVFIGSLGHGIGSENNATLSANQFVTVPLPSLVKNIGGGIWDATNYTYEVPFSGTYLLKSSVRLVDNKIQAGVVTDNSPIRNLFQGVDKANNDFPDGIWVMSPDVNAVPHDSSTSKDYRFTMLYSRIAYFNKGEKVRLFIYSDGIGAKISDASLNIVSLSAN